MSMLIVVKQLEVMLTCFQIDFCYIFHRKELIEFLPCDNDFCRPAVVAWIVRALFSHSVEECVLAIGGSNESLFLGFLKEDLLIFL